MNLKIACVMCGVALIPQPPSPAAQSSRPLALALVRPDGILTPVAVYEAGKWIDPWPEVADERKIDRMLAAVPSYWRERKQVAPETWHVRTRAGAPVTRVNVLSHVIYDEHCGNQVGMLTDLPRSGDNPHEKRIATDRVVPISFPADLTARNASREGWQDLIEEMEAEASRQEAAAKVGPATLRLQRRVRRLYAHADPGIRAIYYEIERRESPRSSFVVTGWVVSASGARPAALETQSGTVAGETHVVSLQPLALLPIGNRTLWIVQEHGYESEAIVIIDLTGREIRRIYDKFIGGC